MSKAHFQLNRPVHLAQLNVYFEKAHEQISIPFSEIGVEHLPQHIDWVTQLLTKAMKHAFIASCAPTALDKEKDFYHFLELISNDLQSLQALLMHQFHTQEEESFLFRFLRYDEDKPSMPSKVYNQRLEDSVQDIHQVISMAMKPFDELRISLLAHMDEDEKERFERACGHLREDLAAEVPLRADG